MKNSFFSVPKLLLLNKSVEKLLYICIMITKDSFWSEICERTKMDC